MHSNTYSLIKIASQQYKNTELGQKQIAPGNVNTPVQQTNQIAPGNFYLNTQQPKQIAPAEYPNQQGTGSGNLFEGRDPRQIANEWSNASTITPNLYDTPSRQSKQTAPGNLNTPNPQPKQIDPAEYPRLQGPSQGNLFGGRDTHQVANEWSNTMKGL